MNEEKHIKTLERKLEELEKRFEDLLESECEHDDELDLRLKINKLRHENDHPDKSEEVWRGYVQ